MVMPAAPGPVRKRRSPLAWLQSRFFTGLAVAAPLGATFWLVWTFVSWVDKLVWGLAPDHWQPAWLQQSHVPGAGLLIGIVALTALGALFANLLGRSALRLGESWLDRVPIVRSIYSAFKQISEAVFGGQKSAFEGVCMVQYPSPGIWCLGFVTGQTRGEANVALGDDYVGVFIPTPPNPANGWLVFVRRTDVRMVDLSVEHAAKVILSLGLFQPDHSGRDPRNAVDETQADSGDSGR